MRYSRGVICPVWGEPKSWEFCRQCNEKYKFKCFPPPLLEYIYELVDENAPRIFGDITVTELLDCPRKIHIHKEQGFYINPDHVYQAWKGIISHQIMQNWTKPSPGFKTLIEERFYVSYSLNDKDYALSFQPDRIDYLEGKEGYIYDFKFVKDLPTFKKPYRHHKLQVNIYSYLLSSTWLNCEITKLYIIYMTYNAMDVYEVEMDNPETIKSYIDTRLNLYEKKVPVLFDNAENWRCKFCEVLPICYMQMLKEGYDIELKLKGDRNASD